MLRFARSTPSPESHSKRRLLFTSAMLACLASLTLSTAAVAFQLQIKDDNVQLRALSDGAMRPVGILTAGSTVDVPDDYRVMRSGHVDVQASLAKWLSQSGYSQTRNPQLKSGGDANDFFFPVHIVRASPMSAVAGLHANREYYVSLRYLAQHGALLQTTEKAPVYDWQTTAPLESLAARAEMAQAARSVEATADCHCGETTQAPAFRKSLSDTAVALHSAQNQSPKVVRQFAQHESAPTQRLATESRVNAASEDANTAAEIRFAMANRYARSQFHCWHAVKAALYAGGLVPRGSLTTGAASSAISDLRRQGWTNLVTHGQSDLRSRPDLAPVGSVIVYSDSQGGYGHTEIRTSKGFVSDYFSPVPAMGRRFHIIGVMSPP